MRQHLHALFTAPSVDRWEFAALTDIGRARTNNEDAVGFDEAMGLAVLADGMGGYQGGEVASGMAVELVQKCVRAWTHDLPAMPQPRALRRVLQQAVDEANLAIYSASRSNTALRGMGTTLVVAAFGTQRVLVGHVGDSRCYRLRDGKIERLTKDHSVLQEQIDAGNLTPEQAAVSPHRNLVTRAVGVEARVGLELHEHSARPDDLFLLCSDGLTEMISDEHLFTLLSQDITVEAKTTLLVAIANDNGGRDNVAVVLAKALKTSQIP